MRRAEGFFIRPMTESDLEEVIVIERETPEAPHWNQAEYVRVTDLASGGQRLRLALVADAGRQIAGFAILRLPTAQGGEAELESIVVRASMRAHGIGAALLAEVRNVARAGSASRLDVEVRQSNLDAIKLYERAGLCVDGHRPRYYSAPEEDAVLMSVNL